MLQATPLQQLAQERTNVAEAGWQPDSYEALVRSCPLYTALLAAGGALRDAAAVSVSVCVLDQGIVCDEEVCPLFSVRQMRADPVVWFVAGRRVLARLCAAPC